MNDTITGLMKLGLTEYEARAYAAVVSMGEGGIGDISQESGIPRARMYDIMERLAGKGFVEIGSSKPLLYRANEPKRVIDNLVGEFKTTAEDVTSQLLHNKKKNQKNLTPVWIIPDDRGIDIKIKEILDSDPGEITILVFSAQTLIDYGSRIVKVSDRVKVVFTSGIENWRGLLGCAELVKVKSASSIEKKGIPTLELASPNGKRTIEFEVIILTEFGSLVVYEDNGVRTGMYIEDSLFDWVIKTAIKEQMVLDE